MKKRPDPYISIDSKGQITVKVTYRDSENKIQIDTHRYSGPLPLSSRKMEFVGTREYEIGELVNQATTKSLSGGVEVSQESPSKLS